MIISKFIISLELDKLRRSKYVRSRIENTFEETAEYLKNKRPVFFTGTPCQTEGLLSYLSIKNIDTSLLYTQDLICHGTVLPSVWRKYLCEKKEEYNSEIKNISFRSKNPDWNKQGIRIEFQNGMGYFALWSDDVYMKIFLEDYMLTESCYNCKYRGARKSDVTVADFWGISVVDYDAYNNNGTSVVIVNTSKGEELLSSVKEKIFFKEESLNDIAKYNPMYYTTVKKAVTRSRFLEMADKISLEEAYETCKEPKFRIWGSFNSRCIANCLTKFDFQISNNSIISLFSSPCNELNGLSGNNPFRNEMLRIDICKNGIEKLKQKSDKSDYLLIDFLEERFGIIDFSDGKYITNSDALKDTGFCSDNYKKYEITDNNYIELWKDACEKFVSFLKENISSRNIILIRMLLSEKLQDGTFYPDAEIIRAKNNILTKMYDIFMAICKEKNYLVRELSIPESMLYTELNHTYGHLPEHFNKTAIVVSANSLKDIINEI